MEQSVADKLEQGPMFDMAIVGHYFTPYMRDYDILVDVVASVPDRSRSYVEGRYRYRFTHCVLAEVTTAKSDSSMGNSWDDILLDYKAWETAEYTPEGYFWGVCWQIAYPGLTYIKDSSAAQEWSERLRHPMHEITIEADAHHIRLIFHDVVITKVADGDPQTNDLTVIETGEIISATGASATYHPL